MRKILLVVFVLCHGLTNAFAESILEEELKLSVSKYILKHLPYEKINIREIKINGSLSVTEGDLSYEILLPRREISLNGKTILPVRLMVNNQYYKNIGVVVDLEVMQDVVLTLKSLPPGHIMIAEDLYVESRVITDLPHDSFKDTQDILGKRIRSGIRAGTMLTAGMVEEPLIIKKGDQVLIVAESEMLRVLASGRAKEAGAKGEMIKIENVNSKKIIFARVVDAGTVKVDF
jgi:flagella basal body P-ring formation protein FlgA